MRRHLFLLPAVLVLVGTTACGGPSHSRATLHVSEADPLPTDPNMLVSDLAEAGGPDAPNVQCKYLPALTGPDSAPSTKTIVPVLAVPSDVTPDEGLDRVKICSDGSYKSPMLTKAATNIAVWHRKQNANLHYQTRKHTYTNTYNNTTFSIREVRRFNSSHNVAYFNNKLIIDSNGNSPRLDALQNEMAAAGWNVTNTHYAIVLISKGQPTTSTCNNTKCPQKIGVARIPGAYDFTVRTYAGFETKIRYGCALVGDAYVAHEQTHESGANHVSQGGDLMYKNINRSFTDSPPIAWNSDPDQKYAQTVLNSGYAVTGYASETAYKTC